MTIRMSESKRPNFVYDPEHEVSYGYWKCSTCNAKFYDGSGAMHNSSCSRKDEGRDACVYHFGPKEVQQIKKHGRSLSGPVTLTLETLSRFFPHLVNSGQTPKGK